MPPRLSPWLPISGIPALLPDDHAGPDATSGGGGQPPADPAPAQPDLGDPGQKALREERAAKKAAEKRAADAEARAKALEEEKLSEQERVAKRAAEAEERAAKAEARALRIEVATEAGLPIGMAGRLQGATKEELEADAEVLKGFVGTGTSSVGEVDGGTQSPPQKTSRAPKPDPSQGPKPGSGTGGTYAAGVARAKAKFEKTQQPAQAS